MGQWDLAHVGSSAPPASPLPQPSVTKHRSHIWIRIFGLLQNRSMQFEYPSIQMVSLCRLGFIFWESVWKPRYTVWKHVMVGILQHKWCLSRCRCLDLLVTCTNQGRSDFVVKLGLPWDLHLSFICGFGFGKLHACKGWEALIQPSFM